MISESTQIQVVKPGSPVMETCLDSIRLRVNGITPTLSLIRLVIVRKSLRRASHHLQENRG